jgi:outer membrane protein assembly factor BamA
MTAGLDLFIREIRFIGQFTQASSGGNLVYGFQTGDFSRMFVNYSYEQVKVKDLNPLYTDLGASNPFLQDSLLIGQGGRRTISKVAPSWVFNTVDQPIFPTSGTRYTFSLEAIPTSSTRVRRESGTSLSTGGPPSGSGRRGSTSPRTAAR